MSASPVDFVLFDLGGVLIELGGMAAFQTLAGLTSEEDVWTRWLGCPWVRRFEMGKCSATEFSEGLVDDWQLEVSPREFLETFEAWPIGPFPGAEELLADVQASLPIGCCSNTNTIHWAFQSREWPMMSVFDHTFLSFELGLVKPDHDMFTAVTEQISVEPGRVLFLDDVALNTDAARAFGFHAEQVRGPGECRAALVEWGVLSA